MWSELLLLGHKVFVNCALLHATPIIIIEFTLVTSKKLRNSQTAKISWNTVSATSYIFTCTVGGKSLQETLLYYTCTCISCTCAIHVHVHVYVLLEEISARNTIILYMYMYIYIYMYMYMYYWRKSLQENYAIILYMYMYMHIT